jgi:hypothetical protein
MKKHQVIGLILSNILIISGFVGFLRRWFSGVSGNIVKSEQMIIFWLLGLFGIGLFLICLFLTLVGINKTGGLAFDVNGMQHKTQTSDAHKTPSASGQIAFSIFNLIFGGFLFSSVFALYALSHATIAKHATNNMQSEHSLKTAKKLNTAAISLAVVQFITVVFVMILAFIKFTE